MALGCLSKFAIVVAVLAVAGRLFVNHAIDEARAFGSGVRARRWHSLCATFATTHPPPSSRPAHFALNV